MAASTDALVKIDSLVGVSVVSIDSVPSGSAAALQPMISSPGGTGLHYAVLTISFVATGTSSPLVVSDFNATFNSIDGSNQITEFNSIDIANGSWQYLSATPTVAVTQTGNLISGTSTSNTNSGGQSINLTDSAAMFKVTALTASSFTVRVGFFQKNNGWNGNDLFSVSLGGNAPQPSALPVNLLSFAARLANDKVDLSWSTSGESNFSHYVVERSYNNADYEQAGFVFGQEVSQPVNNYSFQDPIRNKQASVIYYRLRMVDADGTFKLSDVKAVHIGKAGNKVQIAAYPNPVIQSVSITIPANWQNNTVSGQLLNTNGRITKSFFIQQAGNTITIPMSDVPPGLYIVKVMSGNETGIQTIVKQKN